MAEGQIQPQLAKYLTYKDGLLNDEQKSYFSNGVKQAAIHYKNGILHGRKRLWNEEATLLEEANYIEGKLDGRYYALREDGGEIVFHYKDNQLEGLHQIYYPLDEFFGRIKASGSHLSPGPFGGGIYPIQPSRHKNFEYLLSKWT